MQNKVKLYLTSSPCGNYRCGEPDYPGLNPANGLLEELYKDWPEDAKVLLVSADPEDADGNDEMMAFFAEKLEASGLPVGWLDLCDVRTIEDCVRDMREYDVIIFGGGHVPTANAFIMEWDFPSLLADFGGIIMGISAGTMNCAETVYSIPELEGEAENPDYPHFIRGLGLTDIQVLPHYQAVRWDILDGRRIIEDIACPDSCGHLFYCLPDGSFILQRDGHAEVHGPAYRMQDGSITPFGHDEEVTPLF